MWITASVLCNALNYLLHTNTSSIIRPVPNHSKMTSIIRQKTRRSSRKLVTICQYAVAIIILIIGGISRYSLKVNDDLSKEYINALVNFKTFNDGDNSRINSQKVTFEKPPACTSEQKATILKQLSPKYCNHQYEAYDQLCSFTKATKCVEPTWLESYYKDLKRNRAEDFVAVYVGCNKGYDAVNALRMGTGSSHYDKKVWKEKLQETRDSSVCGQHDNQFPIVDEDQDIVNGYVHCLEPMANNFEKLDTAAKHLGWEDNFLVTRAAISKQTGTIKFEKTEFGVENMGLSIRKCGKRKNGTFRNCDVVNVYTLDQYMEDIAKVKTNGIIHLLSIDVEGSDYDVIKGGSKTLQKTAYLEFEYNWMRPWHEQNLIDAVKDLNKFDFTCYWAGLGKLWRVEESCWLSHFDFHTWSNIACVNRKLNGILAKNMENIFLKTLEDNSVSY